MRKAVLAMLACLGLGGCGGSSSSDTIATVPRPAATGSSPAPTGPAVTNADAAQANAAANEQALTATTTVARRPRPVKPPARKRPSPARKPARPRPARSTALLSAADRSSFAALASSLGGSSGIAVSAVGRGQQVSAAGTLRDVIAWSTSKVPVAMATYAAGKGNAEASALRQAITASDNAAAEKLWAALGSGTTAAAAADAQLRAAGDATTQMQAQRLRAGYTPFGQTRWSLTAQARFTAGMPCTSAGRQVLALMGQTISAQRWGLGATGDPAQIKGGWGPGSEPGADGGYLDRQMGIVTISGHPIAITIATRPGDGAHETGTAHLTRLARWAVSHVDVSGTPRTPRC